MVGTWVGCGVDECVGCIKGYTVGSVDVGGGVIGNKDGLVVG